MLKKDITFIYLDNAQKSFYELIAEEAEKRGYKTKLTDNKFEKCEIGVYCEHFNHPQFSKFSVIMLHDIIQQYDHWPNIWYREPWDKYDVGILPNDIWKENWDACSQWKYTRPKRGMYKIGWPKADVVAKLQADTYREDFYKEHGMDITKKTVLYAPAWENDGKQDDFVRAMLSLDVNIVVKQAPWNGDIYPEQVANIKEMYELHKDIERVTILPPETNIFEAIAVSDVLVSEESSTMCEAAMMGIPSVSVTDWLIPDTTPSRLSNCYYDFAVTALKSTLRDTVKDITDNYEKYHSESMAYAEKNFINIGKTSSMIMDIIDAYVEDRKPEMPSLEPKTTEKIPFFSELKRKMAQFRLEVHYNYSVRNKAVGIAFAFLKKIKRLVCR